MSVSGRLASSLLAVALCGCANFVGDWYYVPGDDKDRSDVQVVLLYNGSRQCTVRKVSINGSQTLVWTPDEVTQVSPGELLVIPLNQFSHQGEAVRCTIPLTVSISEGSDCTRANTLRPVTIVLPARLPNALPEKWLACTRKRKELSLDQQSPDPS